MAFKLVSAAASHVGRVRSSNQDSGYSGYQLFFVADGMGGHAGGEFASALSSQRIAQIDANYATPDDAGAAMLNVILEANQTLNDTVANHPELSGMGTTFSGMLFVDEQAMIGHIGDSRIYLYRDGALRQITKDHTFVQRLVDLGRITPEEALVHPRRNVIMRVLGDTNEVPQLDAEVLDVKPGDRWLLCSDGLCGYVSDEIVERNLGSSESAEEITEVLIGEALEAGAPDNVTIVIVDVLSESAEISSAPQAKYVGAAENEIVIEERKGRKSLGLLNPRILVDIFKPTEEATDFQPESDELLDKFQRETVKKLRWRRVRQLATIFLLSAVVLGGMFFAYQYTQTKYYVAESNGHIAIFKGIREELGPIKFSKVFEERPQLVADLPDYQRNQVKNSIFATSYEDADRIVKEILKAAANG
jgi:serine/threonine protein phosphatase PrpC